VVSSSIVVPAFVPVGVDVFVAVFAAFPVEASAIEVSFHFIRPYFVFECSILQLMFVFGRCMLLCLRWLLCLWL
jgi:hypothetical protein